MVTTSDRRTKPVKVRGLLLNPPDGGGPRPVYVNDDDDWLTIYRHPNLLVTCLTTDCPTRLIAKQMSKTGSVNFDWSHGDGLIWPRVRLAGVLTV